ncbi:MAG TPA: hypothetical protein PL010_17555, partial [Flavobacteriales bacterium]|nr:hypothetical protein [Flavobacteriales bacterium]
QGEVERVPLPFDVDITRQMADVLPKPTSGPVETAFQPRPGQARKEQHNAHYDEQLAHSVNER